MNLLLFLLGFLLSHVTMEKAQQVKERQGRAHNRQKYYRDELAQRLSYEDKDDIDIGNYKNSVEANETPYEEEAYDRSESTEQQEYEPNTSQHTSYLPPSQRTFSKHSDCEIKYETVSVVKQVPSFTKHCHKVDDTKCKTIFKNAFTTNIETQCTATFDTSCDSTLETAYKQECKIIKDVECRIVNLEDSHGGHTSKKICEDVPTEKCVPVPVKVEGQQCVNIPVQKCENVPVRASVPVPKQQCFKKPRKVCQTLVSTKPKVITAQIPREHCGHSSSVEHNHPTTPKKTTSSISAQKMREFFGQQSEPMESLTEELNGYNDDYDYADASGARNADYSSSNDRSNKFNSEEGFDQNLLHFLKKDN